MINKSPTIRCLLHGSFQKHFEEIKRVHQIFSQAGIKVLAPQISEITSINNGFAILSTDDQQADYRLIELLYLNNLRKLGQNGFSYFVNPEGYIGKSASYELGIAQVTNIPCFFLEKLADHPAYQQQNSIWKPEALAEWIKSFQTLPQPTFLPDEKAIYQLWKQLILPGSTVAVGGIIEFNSRKSSPEKEILLVKTHKWGNRYSVVGGKVRQNEKLSEALLREVKEETGLSAEIGQHLCTFDQIKNSGYYQPTQHIFIDQIVKVFSKNVQLNEEAQEYLWIPAKQALQQLDIEPNARHTLELYALKL